MRIFYDKTVKNMEHTISPPAHVFLIAADNYRDDPEDDDLTKGVSEIIRFLFAIEVLRK